MFPAKVILHPTDFHEASAAAFEAAKELAKLFKAKIIVLHVPEMPQVMYSEFGPPMAATNTEIDQEAKDRLEALAREDGGPLEKVIEIGPAEDVILQVADNHQCDLIVMGTAGRRGITRFLLGSVAEHVSRKAHCPVLLVKAPEEAGEHAERAHAGSAKTN